MKNDSGKDARPPGFDLYLDPSPGGGPGNVRRSSEYPMPQDGDAALLLDDEMTNQLRMDSTSNIRFKLFGFYWLPVVLYCLLIFVQSSYPVTPQLRPFPHADKLAHAGGYALLGFLFFRAYRASILSKGILMLVVVSALSSSLYGVSDEIHQYFVPSRSADIADMLANAGGSVVGAVAAQRIFKKSRP